MTIQGASAGVGWDQLAVSDGEFALFRDLIKSHCGIDLSDKKRGLLQSRLARRVVACDCRTFMGYYRMVTGGGSDGDEEFTRMIDLITTNKTEFFRDPDQFEVLTEKLREMRHQPCIRIASLGCSTGEEPYTMGMVAMDAIGPAARSKVEIHGLDLCTEVLRKARTGVYPIDRVDELPAEVVSSWFLRGTGKHADQVQVVPEIRDMVHLRQHNLLDPFPFSARFDIVYCRNVSIYFDQDLQRDIYLRIHALLKPQGLFFMGSAESLVASGLPFAHIEASVYRRKGTK